MELDKEVPTEFTLTYVIPASNRMSRRKRSSAQGVSGALAGTVIGKRHTIVHFGISLGVRPQAVPVPQAGTLTPTYNWGGGFVFNDDLVLDKGVGRQFHTASQWHEAINMVLEMEEKLCKAATGKPCAV